LQQTIFEFMTNITVIEDALKRISGEEFQEFCNHFLFYKLNPNSIDPIGSVIGKHKSRKGIPDCYITDKDGEYVFIEYTTKEKIEGNLSFINKLKSDIINCFDQTKTRLKPEDISQVILCYTERLKPAERTELNELCHKYNPACKLSLIGIRDLAYAVFDYPSLGKYIGEEIGTGQIQTPHEFISNYDSKRFSTPLSNDFFFRESEITSGLEILESNKVLLLSGKAGTGKSKLAIELCKRFTTLHNDYNFICIGNNNLPIWEDLKVFIIKGRKYIIFVDDANRLTTNYQLILSQINTHKNNLKIVVTVRDYALKLIQDISKDYIFSAIETKEFEKEEISKILKSKTIGIKNPIYIDRIWKISKGNVRLAIMAAKVAKDYNDFNSLNDASQIYEEYFAPIFNDIELMKQQNTLKVLSVISFFRKINKENIEYNKTLFNHFNIDENLFWETCQQLNQHELVDLYENQIVKISDQIFSTYIFYKAVIDREIIKFSLFLDNFMEYENRINEIIFPVIEIFGYKNVKEKLKSELILKWNNVNQNGDSNQSIKFLKIFGFYLPTQALSYIKHYIDKLEEDNKNEFRYDYKNNEFSFGVGDLLELLVNLNYLDEQTSKDSIELMFYLSMKQTSNLPAVMYLLKERFTFSMNGRLYGDYIQHNILDFLISNATEGKYISVYEQILLEVIPHYLKIEYRDTSWSRKGLTIHTLNLALNESIKSFRQKCYDYLLMKGVVNKALVLQTINNLSLYEYKNSKEIYLFDRDYIIQIFDQFFDPAIYIDCFIVQNTVEILGNLRLSFPKEFKLKFVNKHYKLTELLKRDKEYRKKGLSHDEREKLHNDKLLKFCRYYQLQDYKQLFEDVNQMFDSLTKKNIAWQFSRSMDVIVANIAQNNYALFLEVFQEYTKYTFNTNYFYLFNCYFSSNAKYYFELYSLVSNLSYEIKLNFHHALVSDYVSSSHLNLLHNDLIKTLDEIKGNYCFWNLLFVEKYSQTGNSMSIYEEISDLVLRQSKEDIAQISVGESFIKKCIEIEALPLDKITSLYFLAEKTESHFDYEKEILKILIEKDTHILINLLHQNYNGMSSLHKLEHEHFDFIWGLEKHKEIILSLIEFFIEKEKYIFMDSDLNTFFPTDNSKYGDLPLRFIHEFIQVHFDDKTRMEYIFNVIYYRYPVHRDRFLKQFLQLNSNFEIFADLDIVKKEGVYSGSLIPYIENHKDSWKKVLDIVNELPNRMNYFDHIEFVDKEIAYCDMEIKRELKKEFMNED